MRLPLATASVALLVLALAASPSPARGADKAPAVEVKSTGTPGVATAVRKEKLTATVKAVDVPGRTITLEWKGGQTGSFKVRPEVRLDQVSAGDTVRLDVEQQLTLEVQPPGSADVPFTVADSGAPATTAMAAGALSSTGLQATVKVTGVDRKARTVKFQDPAGATYAVKAGPGLQIDKLEAGDRLLATYVEAMAVRLEKAPAKP